MLPGSKFGKPRLGGLSSVVMSVLDVLLLFVVLLLLFVLLIVAFSFPFRRTILGHLGVVDAMAERHLN